jgi:putative peptidoglycan lipid II flippase
VDVAADLLRWFAPQPVLLGAGVVLGATLRAQGRPLAAVAGPALGSLVIVGSLVWFHQLVEVSDATSVPAGHLAVLAGGTTLAALVLVAVPAVLVWRTGVALRPAVRAPVALAAETRGVAQALVLTALGLVFATVVAVVVTFRSGVGVLPVLAYLQGVLLVPYAALLLPVVSDALPRLAGVPTAPAAPVTPADPEAPFDPEATTVLTRSARHRRAPSVGALAGRARVATALGAAGAAAVAAAAIPVGTFFTALDAARETTQGRTALDALTPGLWAGAPSLLLLGLVGVLCAALYVRGRPFVAGGAVAAAWLLAGAVPLVAVMPGATPTWTLVVLGVAPVAGLTLATLDLLAATSRAWGPGALAGLGRTVSVAVLAAAAGAAAGILAGRWWAVEGTWANAGVAVALAVLGAAVTAGVLAVADRATAGQLGAVLRRSPEEAE